MKNFKRFTLLMIIVMILATILSQAQTTNGVKPKAKAQTEQTLTQASTKTAMLYKGQLVYKSINNKLYVVKKSKNGNYYKLYVEANSF